MNIRIICVGKLKEKYWKDAVAEYSKRMTAYGKISFEEIKESPGDDIIEEGRDILARIKKDEYVITFEIKGKPMSSFELAKRIEELGIRGQSRICFVIGGSNGLSEEVTMRSDLALSFSEMTFPHQLMRVILMEQIYRSFKIIRGEEYHK